MPICLKCLHPLGKEPACYGLHPACFTSWFKVPSDSIFTNLSRQSSDSSAASIESDTENNSFFLGTFKKYSATLGEHAFILKMRQPEAPELPEVEYLCNQIGVTLNIPVADFFIINFNDDRVFVTKNFTQEGETLKDLQHIYHFRKNTEHSCKNLIAVIKKQTHKSHDVNTFIKTILFDALIGNHDRHGRNLGFLISAHERTLSPIYDNVSYLSLEAGNMLKADFNPTGRIATEHTHNPSMTDYVRDLHNLGFDAVIHQFYNKINLKKINTLIQQSFCSPLMQQALQTLFLKRYQEFKNEIRP